MWRKLAFYTVMACALPLAHAEFQFYGFDCISNNNAANCPSVPDNALSTQFFVRVSDEAGAGQVLFSFFNLPSGAASSITDVYFDDGTLLGIASVNNFPGVDFSQGASPGDLPSGNSADPDFEATAGFTADSNPPTQSNGVNPGERLDIIFNLIGGKTYADTIAALNGPLGVGDDLRIGIHVQGYANGGSEAFVNNPGGPVPDPFQATIPEPSSVVLLGTTLLGVCCILRKRFAA